MTLSCWSFINYPGKGIFPPLAAQANIWELVKEEHPLINSVMS